MPLGDPLPGLLAELRDGDPARRVQAARRIAGWERVPAEAAPTLVLSLEDEDGTEYEEWVDWGGAVTGGETHRASHYAATALGKCGAPGLVLAIAAAVGGAPGARALLPRVILAAPLDGLVEVGAAERARAHRFATEAGDVKRTADGRPFDYELELAEQAHRCLAWADDEEARDDPEWQRTARRLAHPRPEVAREAAEAMARCPDKVWAAATLVDHLLLEDLAYTALEPAGRSLVALGPVLDERRFQVLLEAACDNRPFGALGSVFRCLAAHGRAAAPLAPTLVGWLQRKPPRQVGRDYGKRLRWGASQALTDLGEHAAAQAPVMKALRAAAADRHPDQQDARKVLEALEGRPA